MKNWEFHRDFKLNGIAFDSIEDVLEYATTLSVSISEFLQDWFSEKSIISVKTSGSTGAPKWIKLEKDYMINSAKATGVFFKLPEKTSALLCLPTAYIAGKMMLIRAMTLGWHLDIVEPNANPLKEIQIGYDFSAMVPLQLRSSLEQIHLIKNLIVGGGEVSKDLEEKIQDISTHVYATYGMTETITHIAVKKLNHLSHAELISASHYQLLPNIFVSKDDRDCLVIKASNVSSSEIITNDVVEVISETSFHWKGRYDNVINSGGIKLHPEEIEKKLSEYINSRFFVTGVTDEKLGEKLILIIEGKENNVILNKVKNLKVLSKFEIPKQTFFVSKFVETETGKIQRAKTLDLI